jgi:hypothetical protein
MRLATGPNSDRNCSSGVPVTRQALGVYGSCKEGSLCQQLL